MAQAGWYVEVTPRRKLFRGEKWGLLLVREGNYEPLMQGEGYVAKSDAVRTAHLIADPAGAEVKVTPSD